MIVDSLWATGKFLLAVVPLFILGFVLAQVFVELRWLDKLSWLARPLAQLGRLHPECAGAFVVAIISPTAGHSMLAKYHQEKRIRRSELIIAAIVNALPGYIAQGRSVLPIAVPLLGVLGFVYYVAILFADLVKSLLLLGIGRLILPERGMHEVGTAVSTSWPRPELKPAFRNALRSARKTVPKIVLTMVPVTFCVFALIRLGIFEYAARHLSVVSHYFPIPIEALPIVAARLVSPVGAYTVAGSLLTKGILSGPDVMMALLGGTLLATIPNVRYLVPYYFGIFGPSIGLQLVVVSTLARILVFAAIVGIAALWI
jgi:hypothetical protein